jgi:hypothetical protein
MMWAAWLAVFVCGAMTGVVSVVWYTRREARRSIGQIREITRIAKDALDREGAAIARRAGYVPPNPGTVGLPLDSVPIVHRDDLPPNTVFVLNTDELWPPPRWLTDQREDADDHDD